MAPFDINNQYKGNLFGKDRVGHTTPDAEASEWLRPWLTVPYPAPYLPFKRQDQGHPVLANVVLSSQQVVGQDNSGGLVPAGLFSGTQAAKASGGQYCVLVYGAADVGFTYNAQTGALVAVAGEKAWLAAPSDGVNTDVVTLLDGSTISPATGDVTFAKACDLFGPAAAGGVAKPIGVATRNVFQYLGGVTVTSTSTGMKYTLNGVLPTKFAVHNYMHEMGTAIQTQYVIRLPWLGAFPDSLRSFATTDTVTGYAQGYGRSFVHFSGAAGGGAGQLKFGAFVVPSRLGSNAGAFTLTGLDAGNYQPYDSTKHAIDDVCGRIIGIQNMYPVRDFTNRVRTLWDPSHLVGPVKDPNPASILMGGSATAGIDYQLSLTTDGALSTWLNQGKAVRPEFSTYVLVRVNL